MAEQIDIHVDLEQQAASHLKFLKAVRECRVLQSRNTDVVRVNAIHRYEKYWLPLAADHVTECLSAPLDIEWAWHCHMLAPQRYRSDCEAIVGTLINHTTRSDGELEQALIKSEKYWREKYPNEEVSFQFDPDKVEKINNVRYTDLSRFLMGAMSRQSSFYYQVSLPHFRDNKFIATALERYKKFLYLKSQLPDEAVVPCFDIDLIWHAHQTNPVTYIRDTEALLGYVLIHDDDVGGQDKTAKLHADTVNTASSWRQVYKEPFAVPGAMYRGPDPDYGIFHHAVKNAQHLLSMGIRVTNVSIQRAELHSDHAINRQNYDDVRVIITAHTGESYTGCLAPMPDTDRFRVEFVRPVGFDTHSYPLYSSEPNYRLELVKLGRQMCFKRDKSLAAVSRPFHAHFADLIRRLDKLDDKYEYVDTMFVGNGTRITFTGKFSTSLSELSQLTFCIEVGGASTATSLQVGVDMPAHWGPFTLEDPWTGGEKEESYRTATHLVRFKTDEGNILYKAKIYHMRPSGRFLVQIYAVEHMADDQLLAAAHLIGQDQLPRPDQVEDGRYSLDTDQNELAVIVKSGSGDWGLVKGRPSVCVTKEQDSMAYGSEKESPPSAHDPVDMTFSELSTAETSPVSFDLDRNNLQTDAVEVNLETGEISMHPSKVFEIMKALALTFDSDSGILYTYSEDSQNESPYDPHVAMTFTKLSTGDTSHVLFDLDRNYIHADAVEVNLETGYVSIQPSRAFEIAETLALTFAAGILYMYIKDSQNDTEASVLPTSTPEDQNSAEENQLYSRKFFRACAVGQRSFTHFWRDSDISRLCAVCMGHHRYNKPKPEPDPEVLARMRREEFARAEEERRRRDQEEYDRHVKHSAGMCLGCGPSGCRGYR